MIHMTYRSIKYWVIFACIHFLIYLIIIYSGILYICGIFESVIPRLFFHKVLSWGYISLVQLFQFPVGIMGNFLCIWFKVPYFSWFFYFCNSVLWGYIFMCLVIKYKDRHNRI